MATHLRGRAYQAGAFLALIGGFLVVAPAPALADDPTVTINNISSANLKAGERATMTFQVENRNPGPPQEMVITVASTIDELRCEGNCNIRERIPAGQPRQYTVNLVAGSMEAGRSRSGRVEVRANVGDEGASAQRAVTVRGDERPPTVDEVNGRIRDQDGDPVGGAEVAMQDSQGHQYSTTSNSSGRYRFESSDRTPISPGSITVGAQKNGFTRQVRTTSAEAGKSVTVSLTMQSTAAPSPSATPSATPKASATPAEEASDEAAAEQPSAPAVKNTAAQDDDSGSLLFIILGGLLVAAGIGAIILVLMRRKEPDEDPDDVDGGVPAGGVVPPSHGRYGGVPDATRVAGALSGRPADATMVAGPAVPPSIADAPTMLQRAVPADDEFADPYGAPSAVPHAGYAPAAPGGWGTAAGAGAGAAAGAYGAQQYGGAPAPATTYGPAAGSPAPYGGGTGTYGAAAVPVTPPAQGDTGYAAPPASGGGYAGPPASGGGYAGPPASGGYGGPAGGNPYARPPAPAGGYGRPAGDQRFDEPTGWYNQDAGDAGHRGTPPVPDQPGYQTPDPGTGTFRPEPGTGAFHPEPGSAAGGFRPHAPGGHAQVPSQPREPGYGQGAAYPPAPGRGPQDELGQHEPPAAGGYQPGGGYPPAPGGGGYGPDQSGQDTGYGAWSPPGDGGNQYGAPAGGYGRGGGYGAPAGGHGAPAAGHGAPAGGHGYDEATSYDARGTYGRPDGHGQAPGQPHAGRGVQQPPDQRPQPGYGDAAGGYYGDDQGAPQGGRHGGQPTQPPESTHPGQRRPLDWLDD